VRGVMLGRFYVVIGFMGVFQESCEFRACERMPWWLPEVARGPSSWTELGAGRLHHHHQLVIMKLVNIHELAEAHLLFGMK